MYMDVKTQQKLTRASEAIINTVGREEGFRLIHDKDGYLLSPDEIILLAHELLSEGDQD